MTTKIYYTWDETSKYYTGTYEAQESPVRPGTWVHPLNSTEDAPNLDVEVPDGAVWRRNTDNSVWELYMPPEEPVPELSDAEKAAQIKSYTRTHADGVAAVHGFVTLVELLVLAEEDEVLSFQTKALAARAWWANAWNYTLTQTALMLNHTRTFPAEEAWLAELPELVLP